jgi:hypothetical protein
MILLIAVLSLQFLRFKIDKEKGGRQSKTPLKACSFPLVVSFKTYSPQRTTAASVAPTLFT